MKSPFRLALRTGLMLAGALMLVAPLPLTTVFAAEAQAGAARSADAGDVAFLLDEFEKSAGHFFGLKTIDWLAVRKQFTEEVESVSSDAEYLKLCARLAAALKDGHAGVMKSTISWPDESQGRRWTGPRVHLLTTPTNEVYVRTAFGGAAESGIQSGQKVETIDGRPAWEWLQWKVGELRKDRGYSTDHQALYAVCHWGLADWEGTPITFGLRDAYGKEKEVRIVRNGGPNFVPLGPVWLPEGLKNVGRQSYGKTGKGWGYIHLRDVPGNLPEQVEQMLKELEGVKGLILDMRANGGGGCDHAAVFGRFLAKEASLGRYQAQGEVSFAGPMVVIVDAGTRSAGETVAGMFKESGRAYVIGDGATAGTSSSKKTVNVPSGRMTLRFSVSSNMGSYNGGRGIEGIGIPPLEVVGYEPKDLLNKVDTQIAKAEALLEKGLPDGVMKYVPPGG